MIRLFEKRNLPPWVFAVALLTSILVLCVLMAFNSPIRFCGGNLLTDREPRLPIKVDAQELFAAYGRDQAAADKMYTGRMVELENVCFLVRKDKDGRQFLAVGDFDRFVKPEFEAEFQRDSPLRSPPTRYPKGSLCQPGIILNLAPEEMARMPDLDVGQVTVRGECKGKTEDPRTEPGYFVTVDGVRIITDD